MDLSQLMRDYAVESGEMIVEQVPENTQEMLNDLLIQETIAAGEPTVTAQLDQAETSEDIADQLDDLADRADAVIATQADPETAVSADVLNVSIESLHREFNVVMRAHKLQEVFKASSFESAGSDSDRLTGLAADARRTAVVTRGHAKALKDLSAEAGDILRFLRQDKARLQKANATLGAAVGKLNGQLADLKDDPKIINHEGIGRWLTVEGKPIKSLKDAVEDEAKWLGKAHDAVDKLVTELKVAATKLKGDPTLSVDTLLPASMFTAVNGLSTGTGALMGNITITGVSTGEKVFKYKRENEFVVSKGKIAKAVGWGILATIGWGLVGGLGIAIGGVLTGGLISGLAGTSVGVAATNLAVRTAGAVSAAKSYDEDVNKSEAQSVANPSDLKSALTTILGYTKFTNFHMDVDGTGELVQMLDAIDEFKGARVASGAIFDALSRCMEISEIIYDQAIYTTTSAATLASKAV